MMKVMYGTSDHFPNFGEVVMVLLAAEHIGGEPGFFHYPKGPAWGPWEEGLFEPYTPPSKDPGEALAEAGLPPVDVLTLHEMAEGEIGELKLGEIAQLIRSERQIQAFRAVNLLPPARPVYVSSKNRAWREWASRPLAGVINDPSVKLGGAFFYFLYGAWLARHRREVVGLLPKKQKPDVIGAFLAGQKWARQEAKIVTTGEFDFMTRRQLELWQEDRRWRKAPAWAARRLLQNREILEEVKERLLLRRQYSLLVVDEESQFLFEEF